jgi:hypothetical protein
VRVVVVGLAADDLADPATFGGGTPAETMAVTLAELVRSQAGESPVGMVGVGATGVLVLLLAYDPLVPRFAGERVPVDMLISFGAWLKAGGLVAAAGGAILLVALRSGSLKARFTGIAVQSLAVLAGLLLAIVGFDALSPIRSSWAILRSAQQAEAFAIDAPFYQIGMYDQTVPFYLGRATRGVEYRHELSLGIDAEPQKQIPTVAEWITEWQRIPRGYALMDVDLHAPLVAQGVPMRELARGPRHVIVSRR